MLRSELRLEHHVPLAPLTTWGVGGPADCLFRPLDVEQLHQFLAELPAEQPLVWIGLGSNLLVRDGGVRGTVILTHKALSGFKWLDDARLEVQAGVPCAKVARQVALAGYGGAEFLVGIPGTMGGALAMNAGAWGSETWERVDEVQVLWRDGRLEWQPASQFRIGYRSVNLAEGAWFTAVRLRFPLGDTVAARRRMRDLLRERGRTQPITQRSCGSVFRNPPQDSAARLIEAAGLKGSRIGGAMVSQRHANFIINTGDATAADLEAMIERVQQRVQQQFGIHLTPEVRIIGEPLAAKQELA